MKIKDLKRVGHRYILFNVNKAGKTIGGDTVWRTNLSAAYYKEEYAKKDVELLEEMLLYYDKLIDIAEKVTDEV